MHVLQYLCSCSLSLCTRRSATKTPCLIATSRPALIVVCQHELPYCSALAASSLEVIGGGETSMTCVEKSGVIGGGCLSSIGGLLSTSCSNRSKYRDCRCAAASTASISSLVG